MSLTPATSAALDAVLDGKSEIGMTDLRRWLSNCGFEPGGVAVARALIKRGWLRDGHLYTGHDRTPRYVRRHQA